MSMKLLLSAAVLSLSLVQPGAAQQDNQQMPMASSPNEMPMMEEDRLPNPGEIRTPGMMPARQMNMMQMMPAMMEMMMQHMASQSHGGSAKTGNSMMGPGMMGMMPGMGASAGGMVPGKVSVIDVATVRDQMRRSLLLQGNPRLIVGEVKEEDENYIVADITTKDGSLADRFRVDRIYGIARRVN